MSIRFSHIAKSIAHRNSGAGVRLRQRISISGERAAQREKDTLTFEFFDAGHVLGSTGIILRAEGQTIFYTGDVNFDDQTIMQAAIFPEEKIDMLIMECTRGDHAKPAGLDARRGRTTPGGSN